MTALVRRTITLPPDLAREVEAAVAAGASANVSQFLQAAARHYLDALAAAALAREAARLDADEEEALARGLRSAEGRPPWGRLG